MGSKLSGRDFIVSSPVLLFKLEPGCIHPDPCDADDSPRTNMDCFRFVTDPAWDRYAPDALRCLQYRAAPIRAVGFRRAWPTKPVQIELRRSSGERLSEGVVEVADDMFLVEVPHDSATPRT